MPDALPGALQRLLPPGAGAGWADPRGNYPLWPGEALPGAMPARRAEFAAGRHAARMALQRASLPPVAIPYGPDRAPVWPAGVIGSISHSATACLAVAMRAGPWRGIGVDLEPAVPLDPTLWDTVLLPREQAALAHLPPADRGLAALRIFCAKEAVFKAHHPLTQALVGFEVMAVVLTGQTFTGTFLTDIPPLGRGERVQGHVMHADGHILALATV